MEFPYGISPRGFARWVAFQRIEAMQAERGPEVGRAVMMRIVDAELRVIERATAPRKRQRVLVARARKPILP